MSHPRKIKTLRNKLKMEKLVIVFLQETKCSTKVMKEIRDKVWRGSEIMEIDVHIYERVSNSLVSG